MLKLYLTGGEYNTEPSKSLGADPDTNTIVSIYDIDNDELNNLFDNISIEEILEAFAPEIINYRVIAIKNYSMDFTSTNIYLYFTSEKDEIIDDITITYEMALSKYKNYLSGFPNDETACRCPNEYLLPPEDMCISDIYDFKYYSEDDPIFIDQLLPGEYIMVYIKRKVIIGDMVSIDCTSCPKISSFSIKLRWTEE